VDGLRSSTARVDSRRAGWRPMDGRGLVPGPSPAPRRLPPESAGAAVQRGFGRQPVVHVVAVEAAPRRRADPLGRTITASGGLETTARCADGTACFGFIVFTPRSMHCLTPLHGRADILKRLVANIGAAPRHIKAAAEQFNDLDRWGCQLRCISDRIAPVIGPPRPTPGLPATA
jgi:hypothetical protein